MGRLAVIAAGDSSPCSAESTFRELDEVFLQTQTRAWLGEVLKTKLDEDLSISDLLQDGEILFEVFKVVWNMLLNKCMELRHLKHKYGPFGSKRSSGRYRPYSNVDSFIKVCKIIGLSSIDLFSPSDVVEKRETKKVCICVRALSKKVRSKQLSIPDFDMVMSSVAMSTDMVGGMRRSLESSQYTSSSSHSSYKGSQMKEKQNKIYVPFDRDDESSSSESDEAESRYMSGNYFSPASKFDDGIGLNSKREESPEAYFNKVRHSHSNCDMAVFENKDGSVVGENNYIADYLAFSDLMVHTTGDSSLIIRDGEKNMFDFLFNGDSPGLASGKKSLQNDEDMEVSSTTSMSSVLGRMLNLEFDADKSSTTNVYFSQNKCHSISECPPCSPVKHTDIANQGDCVAYDVEDEIISNSDAGNGGQDKQEHRQEIPSENTGDGTNRSTPAPHSGKHGRTPLLKTVVKGTAIAGVLFFLLHIRKGKCNIYAQETKKDIIWGPVYKESKFMLMKQSKRGSRGKGVYPAEKFKF